MNHVLSPEQEVQLAELRSHLARNADLRGFASERPMYWNRQGEPIDLAMFCVLTEDEHYRRVAHTEVGLYRVSTIWLGIDFGMSVTFGMSDRPTQLFETMVFGDGFLDLDCYRWATEDAAVQGHEEVVTLVRGTT